MDENPVCADMVSATTADDTSKKIVTIKTTTQKKLRFSVCLTAKEDGTKFATLHCSQGWKLSSPNAWMITELTHT